MPDTSSLYISFSCVQASSSPNYYISFLKHILSQANSKESRPSKRIPLPSTGQVTILAEKPRTSLIIYLPNTINVRGQPIWIGSRTEFGDRSVLCCVFACDIKRDVEIKGNIGGLRANTKPKRDKYDYAENDGNEQDQDRLS